jgi:hypothetical protein
MPEAYRTSEAGAPALLRPSLRAPRLTGGRVLPGCGFAAVGFADVRASPSLPLVQKTGVLPRKSRWIPIVSISARAENRQKIDENRRNSAENLEQESRKEVALSHCHQTF